ncbi:hypothetical protein BESB_052050 [Besnoitia besnoiti]|uniref:Uncharacterized protein n=1 Tax=Besnoitia besnoiti TaxID=94643 RepID=A0A2A9MEC9_BESBE|nr:hypothetical protein BESB_052050 [Besnoitia besnoiti]PFH35554.1 hypothetical protein BESB_052050 [Besnoitia besnoiti]
MSAWCSPGGAGSVVIPEHRRRRSDRPTTGGAAVAKATLDALSLWADELKSLVEMTAYGLRDAADEMGIGEGTVRAVHDVYSDLKSRIEDGASALGIDTAVSKAQSTLTQAAEASRLAVAEIQREVRGFLEDSEVVDLTGASATTEVRREQNPLLSSSPGHNADVPEAVSDNQREHDVQETNGEIDAGSSQGQE